ncbi:flagellar basal body-associated FliL family protein [Geodermatophilus sp. YIM 151500]|uniref:flagellar basal body-associated FliL family protein n=1 Tax=Geodermatophilus sp. YIM 151500 TaxID=2984531 RepID=UPI0021E382E6|nr:flagellar basal body-associated FliL family protein [Geodermatophilus sp. YIM 151500]MCV2489503.1 flagellar basal body-associated FliL family protein [Geodermatophilus sp. YIM 151500]
MSTKQKNADAAEETEGGGGGKKKLIMILAVVLLAAAGAAYFFLFAGGEAEAEEPVAGEVVHLEPVAVNLAGGGYLKIGVALELVEGAGGGGHGGGGVDGAKATDLVISTFSQAQPADVTGAREALKEALEQKIVEAYHGDVMEIYYTEYVTQ